MLERRLYFHIDWAMLAAVLALCLIGLVQIYSATQLEPGGANMYRTQIHGSSGQEFDPGYESVCSRGHLTLRLQVCSFISAPGRSLA
jgi:hypothetical protein